MLKNVCEQLFHYLKIGKNMESGYNERILSLQQNHLNNISSKYLPSQANPSPLYPVLHVQIKLPSVFTQAAFLSQGVDAHSSISIK